MTEQITIRVENLLAFYDALEQTIKVYPDLQVTKQQDNTLPFEGCEGTTMVFLAFKEPRALFYLGKFFEQKLQL